MNDSYIYVITALLPLSALMLLLEVNPYHALVTQGILGAVATLVYAVLGAPDVALTQALMGTLLGHTSHGFLSPSAPGAKPAYSYTALPQHAYSVCEKLNACHSSVAQDGHTSAELLR